MVGKRIYCLFVGKIFFIVLFDSIFQFVYFTLTELNTGSNIRDSGFESLYSLSQVLNHYLHGTLICPFMGLK